MNSEHATNYVYCLCAIIVVIPVLVGWFGREILGLTDIVLSVFDVVVTFLITYVLKQSLNDEYSDIFVGPTEFMFALILAGVVLFSIKDLLSMGKITAIITLLGMVVAYLDPIKMVKHYMCD